MSHSSEVEEAGREAELSVPQYALYGEAVADAGHRRVSICCLSDKLKARGWRIQPHTHPHYSQILLVRAGGGTVTMEERANGFRAPAVLVVPALLVHGFAYDRRGQKSRGRGERKRRKGVALPTGFEPVLQP